jgi:transcriptional regulator with GAF, ATPase, and Fis domain
VFPIVLPPLRERLEDLPQLAAHFVEQAARRFGRAAPRLTARALRTLETYAWPGNIREFQHVIERAVLLSPAGVLRLDGVLNEADRAAPPDAGVRRREAAQAVVPEIEWRRRERQNLRAALDCAGGRIYGPGGAAELLGVKPTTLISRLAALGLRGTGKRRRAD